MGNRLSADVSVSATTASKLETWCRERGLAKRTVLEILARRELGDADNALPEHLQHAATLIPVR